MAQPPRLPALGVTSLFAGLVVTLLTVWIERRETMACDTDAGVCNQLVAGYPWAYGVDHWGISPVNDVSLIMLLLGDDIMRWSHFFADWAIWSLVVLLAVLLVKRYRSA